MREHKRTLVFDAGGSIGTHLVRRLKEQGWCVRGVGVKRPPFAPSATDEFIVGDLRDPALAVQAVAGMAASIAIAASRVGGCGVRASSPDQPRPGWPDYALSR